MSRKHYREIADVLAITRSDQSEYAMSALEDEELPYLIAKRYGEKVVRMVIYDITMRLSVALKDDNIHFDSQKFKEAVGI